MIHKRITADYGNTVRSSFDWPGIARVRIEPATDGGCDGGRQG